MYAILGKLELNFEHYPDFALIRIDPGVKVDPEMCFFGGPTGINSDRPSEPVLLHWYGNGIGLGNAQVANQPTLPARSGIALGMPNRNAVHAIAPVIFGDSGSGVISADGRAVGVVSTGGLNSDPEETGPQGVHTGTSGITRLLPQLRRAEKVLGIALHLVKAPLTP